MAIHDLSLRFAQSGGVSALLPDLLLAFAFFTALLHVALGRHFGRQRSTALMAGALGLALAIGLVWWEQLHGWSILDLGPIAVTLAIGALAVIAFRAISKQGGFWAGVGLAVAVCVTVIWAIGVDAPIDTQLVQLLAVASGVVGILGFVRHRHRRGSGLLPVAARVEVADVRRDRRDVDRSYDTSKWIRQGLRRARLRTGSLTGHPGERADLVLQIRRILPAEGLLTERMAGLREKAHRVRNGHVSRLEETKRVYSRLPTSAKKKAAEQLIARYRKLVGMDERLEQLDRQSAETERQVRLLTREAQEVVARYEFPKVEGTLKRAEKLQAKNSHLLKVIDRTERKLGEIVRQVAKQAQELGGP